MEVGPQKLIVLIDSGFTHNFINEGVAELLHLLMVPTDPFNVKVTNGEPLKFQGRFNNVQIELQSIQFSFTLYSLPLVGFDMVFEV